MVTLTARRAAIDILWDRFGLSERRACSLAGLARSTRRYRRRRGGDEELRRRLKELAAERSRSDGRTFRTLNVVDDATRECTAIEVDTSLPGSPCLSSPRPHRWRAWRLPPPHRPRQRPGMHQPSAGPVGLRARRRARLHPARQADRERLRRELQRPLPRRVPQPALVHHLLRRSPPH
jgi:hypothetical protein